MARMSRMSVSLIETLGTDARQVLRQIHKKPAFAGLVVLVLASGFAVSTAMFSTIRTVLLKPLPYRSSERLVQIVSRWPKTGDQNGWSAPLRDAAEWKTTVPAFEDVAAYRYDLVNLTEGPPEALYGLRVSANLLPMLGVGPQLGQWLSAEEDRPGHTHVVLLSDDLWRRRFHADPHIVGKVVHFDSEGYQVLGVMPGAFNFPLKSSGNVQLPTDQMQYWVPLGADLAGEPHGAPNAGVIARLKEGVSLQAAQGQLETACRLLQQQFPATNREYNGAKLQTRGMAAEERSTEVVAVNEVSPGFLETMGVRIINGRSIRETDTADAPKVTIIDQGTTARLWPHQDPLGKLVNTEDPAKPVWRQVVGVVASTRDRSLDIAPRPSIYLPLAQGTGGISFLVVKSLTAPAETIRLLKSVVAGVDPDQSVFFSQTVAQLIQDSMATRRFFFLVMMFFGAAALILSALGIYALVSFLAATRVREVGIRMALGSTRGGIAWLVVFQGIRLALIGTTAGWIGSVLLSRFMTSLLFGVSPFDLGTLLSAVLSLAGVTTLAALIPACRSARLEPMQALRTE
jgi:hypothetical protein